MPEPSPRNVVYLLEASTGVERRLLAEWVAKNGGGETIHLKRGANGAVGRLESRLATKDDPELQPLRIAWLPAEVNGRRSANFYDLLTLSDPRDPDGLRQHWLAYRRDRWAVVVGEPARASELRARWQGAVGKDVAETVGLTGFVVRAAALALERAERALRGARYKVPRLVEPEVLGRPSFRGGLSALAKELGKRMSAVEREARGYLREVSARHSPFVIDLVQKVIRLAWSQGYRELVYDPAALAKILEVGNRYPLVFLPTHKSNLDHAVMQYILHDHDYPPNHTAGGINMNFFPVGSLFRRTGVFFIRRTFKDNPVYKFVLRQYVGYLIEKRFALEWYMEGGRSRSGKLLPPRMGLLSYVADAWRQGRSDDVFLVPVSIAYDQISDVGDYVAEGRGARKGKEGLSWFLKMWRGLRRRYGSIHIRFGEPLSMKAELADKPSAAADDEENISLQKLAFEVCVRTNRATPATPTSLVAMALLERGDCAVTVDEARAALTELSTFIRRRGIPTTGPLEFESAEGVARILDALVENGVLTCYSEGPEAVYAISEDQHLAAAYYRNTILHWFVPGAIAELALLFAKDQASDFERHFFEEALRLRDWLKFEFFFAEKEAFRAEMGAELADHSPTWKDELAQGSEGIDHLMRKIRPFSAHRTARPFLEAYALVADALTRAGPEAASNDALLAATMHLGQQYLLQRRVRSAESISKVLFQSALKLLENRKLMGPGADVVERRKAFSDAMRGVLRRVDGVASLAAGRRAGLIS
jgi:glycerol-3-phosphate O-acyltransferase